MAESKAILNKVVFKVKRGSFNFFSLIRRD